MVVRGVLVGDGDVTDGGLRRLQWRATVKGRGRRAGTVTAVAGNGEKKEEGGGAMVAGRWWWLPRWSVIVVLTGSYGGFQRVTGVYGGSPGRGGFGWSDSKRERRRRWLHVTCRR
ncbi:hypothetical protein HAX54_010495, partial [Datura stramonium]|nr:hypothetical protein [Datura stramonium]